MHPHRCLLLVVASTNSISTRASHSGRGALYTRCQKRKSLCYVPIERLWDGVRWVGEMAFWNPHAIRISKMKKYFRNSRKKNFRIFSGFSRFEANRVKFFGINRIRACHAIIINPPIASNDLQTALKAVNVIAGCRIFFDISTALCVTLCVSQKEKRHNYV